MIYFYFGGRTVLRYLTQSSFRIWTLFYKRSILFLIKRRTVPSPRGPSFTTLSQFSHPPNDPSSRTLPSPFLVSDVPLGTLVPHLDGVVIRRMILPDTPLRTGPVLLTRDLWVPRDSFRIRAVEGREEKGAPCRRGESLLWWPWPHHLHELPRSP